MPSINPSDWLDYLKYLFDQVKLQQEVRDRWFGYYLAIAGGVLAIGVTAAKLFYTGPFNRPLCLFLLGLSLIMFLIGTCFFMLYLRQRNNYRRIYDEMKSAERKFRSFDSENAAEGTTDHLTSRKWGADFFTVWIHIIINSLYFSAFIFFGLLFWRGNADISLCNILPALCGFVIVAISLQSIWAKNEGDMRASK